MNNSLKRIQETFGERWTKDGAGVRLSRVFGFHEIPKLDPFLLLDFFNSKDPKDYEKGFPWHPHRGIETVTYLIHGNIAHGDSLGNSGVIGDGDCQWMTAGSGIIHQEMPQPSEHMLGIQLWVNLPRDSKMTEPAYRDLRHDTLPIVQRPFGQVRVFSGEYDGVCGPVEAVYVKPLFLDVTLKPNQFFEIDVPENDTLISLIVAGGGSFDEAGKTFDQVGMALLFERSGKTLKVHAGREGLRFILIGGKPLDEPIAWGGPIVMNTKEELNLAFAQIDAGTFVKKL